MFLQIKSKILLIMKKNPFFLIFLFIVIIPVTLLAQSGSKGEMPQYLFPEFNKCEILFKDGQINTQVMNYNTVTEKIVYEQDGNYYDLLSTILIDTVYIQNCKFISSGKIFYEVLLSGKIPLFLQNKSDLLPAGKPVGYGGTSQGAISYYMSKHELSPEYINMQIPPDVTVKASPVYWVLEQGEMLSFINKKQFIALFTEIENEIKDFIKENRIHFDKRDDVMTLVKYINGLY